MLFDCSKKDVFWTMDEKGMKSEVMSFGRNERLRMLYGLGFWHFELKRITNHRWMWGILEDKMWWLWKAWDLVTFDTGCESILKWFVTLYNSLEMLIKGLISETKHYWSVLEVHVKVKSRKMFLMLWGIVNKMWFVKLVECHFESCCGSLSKQDNWNGNYLWTRELCDTLGRIERNMIH